MGNPLTHTTESPLATKLIRLYSPGVGGRITS